jgi:hypothetical protein
MWLMEDIDCQVDKMFELKQHIEFIRKDTLDQKRRQQVYLGELFELYKGKDREIEKLQVKVQMAKREIEALTDRRDSAYD